MEKKQTAVEFLNSDAIIQNGEYKIIVIDNEETYFIYPYIKPQLPFKELTEKLEQKTRDCENWSKMYSELLELSVNQKTTIDELREDLKSLELTKQTRLMKQTAVEWFYQRILAKDIESVFEQAKEMEKQQIIDANKELKDMKRWFFEEQKRADDLRMELENLKLTTKNK
jgi:hypothetical protein